MRMAVAPVFSPLPTFTLYQQLADYMGEKLGRPVELVQGKTYAEINDLVKSGDVALALVCTNPYLQGQQDFGMELLVAPLVQGEPYYYSLVIVRRDLDVSSLEDLRGMTFAFTDPLSNTGRLAPLYQLALRGETPESFFSRSIFTYSHDNSIRSVADGIVDAAAVDNLVYDYLPVTEPDMMAKVKVIEKWGPFGINPFVVNPGLDPQLKTQLRDAFLNMDKDRRGQELLAEFMIDRFIVPDDSIYDSVREMRSYLQEQGLGQ
jgi:phosphonate transport system substrate-binding protein